MSVVIAKKNNMENFNTHRWFKKQYLEEGMSDEEIQAIRRFEELTDDDKLKLMKIQAMMDKERLDQSKSSSLIGRMGDRSLKEDDLDEIRFPQTDFTRSQLVPRMEGMVDRETYKRFTDSLDDLLDDWYMEGFEKDDVLAFMKVIIPSS